MTANTDVPMVEALHWVVQEKDAEIERLRAELQGPDGFETWKDAAIDERVRRVKTETEIEDKEASLDMVRSRLGQWETLLRQCREKNNQLESDYRQVLREVNEQSVMLLDRANEIERLVLALEAAETSLTAVAAHSVQPQMATDARKVLEVIRAALASETNP